MANAFFTTNGIPRAVTSIRRDANGQPQSLDASLPDGDTIGVHVAGSGSIRFLGIDTPEKSFELPIPGGAQGVSIPRGGILTLTDPFLPQFRPLPLHAPLADHLRTTHRPRGWRGPSSPRRQRQASAAPLVESDMTTLGQDLDTFGYFLALLIRGIRRLRTLPGFHQPEPARRQQPRPAPPSYNQRMLEAGAALPYFIWPNVDPFREASLLEAVIEPGTASTLPRSTQELQQA